MTARPLDFFVSGMSSNLYFTAVPMQSNAGCRAVVVLNEFEGNDALLLYMGCTHASRQTTRSRIDFLGLHTHIIEEARRKGFQFGVRRSSL